MPVTVKARMRFSSATRRNQWVSVTSAGVISSRLASGYPARCTTASSTDYGTNAALAKYQYVTAEDAEAMFNLMVTEAESRGPQRGSVIRVTDADGEVVLKKEW